MIDKEEIRSAMALVHLQLYDEAELLQTVQGIGSATKTLRFLNAEGTEQALCWADNELQALTHYGIRTLLYGGPDYPLRLMTCYDAPLVLYQLGPANLNAKHVVSIVGTRHCTPEGQQRTQQLVQTLHQRYGHQLLVVSGLAKGIDVSAHRQALADNIATVGILGHGLGTLYPAAHRPEAEAMARQGALLTEYPLGTKPHASRFLQRNRLIAALADEVYIIESAARGGALSAMHHARRYHRPCFAWTGINGTTLSAGCQQLIESGLAEPLA